MVFNLALRQLRYGHLPWNKAKDGTHYVFIDALQPPNKKIKAKNGYNVISTKWNDFILSVPGDFKLHFNCFRAKGESHRFYVCLGEPNFTNPCQQRKAVLEKKYTFEQPADMDLADKKLQEMITNHLLMVRGFSFLFVPVVWFLCLFFLWQSNNLMALGTLLENITHLLSCPAMCHDTKDHVNRNEKSPKSHSDNFKDGTTTILLCREKAYLFSTKR